MKIFLSLNPDGFEMAKEGSCNGRGRDNFHAVDLNRNFPDQFREKNWINDGKMARGQKIELETEAMINWIENSHFVLSLNLHAGSEVASYPYDDGAVGGYSKVKKNLNSKRIQETFTGNVN